MPGKSKGSCQSLIILLLTTTTFAIFPIFLFIFCSIWLVRTCLTWWIKIHPKLSDYGPFLVGTDTILASECPYSKSPLIANTCYHLLVDGRLEVEEFQSRVESRWPGIVGEGKNRRRLTQYLTTWVGFFLYRDELNFKVSDHVRLLDIDELNERVDRQCKATAGAGTGTGTGLRKIPRIKNKIHKDHWTAEELAQLTLDLTVMPFEQNKSPWEFLLLHNPIPNPNQELKETTVIVLRIHHSLADGLSIVFLLSQLLDQSQVEAIGKMVEKFSTLQRLPSWSLFIDSVSTVLRGIPEFISHQVHSWPPGRRPFVEDCTNDLWAFPFEIPLDQITAIRRKNKGVSTTSILMTAFALAVHQYKRAVRNNSASESESDVAIEMPSNLHVICLSAGPRERNEVTNMFLLNPLRITAETTSPDQVQDSSQLLHKINREYLRIVSSRIAKVNYSLTRLFGIMPRFLLSRKLITGYTNGVFTNMPTFETQVSILGHALLSKHATALAPTSADFGVISLGYHDKLCMVVTLDKRTTKGRDQGRRLIKMFEEQLCEI